MREAMAAGTPVVASDIPVFREVAGSAAVLVPPRNPQAWASAIISTQDANRRHQLVLAGRERAAGATWNVTMQRLLAALRRR